MRKRFGLSLIGTLLIASLLLTLAFTTAAMTFSYYTLGSKLDRVAAARSLAEAAANRAVARCLADIHYGTRGDISQDVVVNLDSLPGGWGKVYFGGADPVLFGNIPRSHNFLSQDTPQQSTGRVVPSRSLHIIAIGEYGRSRRAVETVVAIPAYKYAIASSGNITSSGGLLVAGVKNPAAVENGVHLVEDSQWSPGCLLSNSGDLTGALDLDSDQVPSRITGDLKAAGFIKLGDQTTVEGSVRAFSSAEEIPKVEAGDFDTAELEGCDTHLNASEFQLEVTGPARREGNLTVQGGLRMQAGVLFVKGDVEVYGGLHGKGALISTGKVTIHNQGSFRAADDQAAIVAQSDVSIFGSDADTSVYNGVIFTQGNFQGRKMTLLGALCAAGGSGSKVDLQEVNVLSNPISMDLQYSIEGALSDHVANWRRDNSLRGGEVEGYKDGRVMDGQAVPPIVPGEGVAVQIGVTGSHDHYMSNGGFEVGSGYINLVRTLHVGPNDQNYSLNVGDPGDCTYNTDYSKGWDSQANDGVGGFTLEKFRQAYPLGIFDGNCAIHLNDLVHQDSQGRLGDQWAFQESFNGRSLYQALREATVTNQPKKYRMVNKANPNEVVDATLAEVFNPGGDADSDRVWADRATRSWWNAMMSNHSDTMEENPYEGGLPDPLPLEPWKDLTTPVDITKPGWDGRGLERYASGANALDRWLSSLTTFQKPQYQGSWNFNPLQFVQLRDQSQRLLWREYEPAL